MTLIPNRASLNIKLRRFLHKFYMSQVWSRDRSPKYLSTPSPTHYYYDYDYDKLSLLLLLLLLLIIIAVVVLIMSILLIITMVIKQK